MKIGAVTIGQSPRVDVTKDIMGDLWQLCGTDPGRRT